MLSEEMWQLPIVLFDAKSLARSICVSRAWQRAGERKMRDMIAASIAIQRAVRGALAVVRATRLRGARFEQVLYDRDATGGDLSEIPNNLWVAYHACVLGSEGEFSEFITIQSAVEKLEYNGVPVDATPRNYGRGSLAALQFLSALDIEQLMCLGV